MKPEIATILADPFKDPATQKIWAEEHALAFTVAGMARDDILAVLRDGIEEVIAGKLSRDEWLAGARQRLIRAGLWREDGEKGGITPSRLQLIFDTNTANAYAAGRWTRLWSRRETHPYLMYLTKQDERVRSTHRRWHGLVLPIDHEFWKTHFPPNGFRCRCAVLGVTEAEYRQLRKDDGEFVGGKVKFDEPDANEETVAPGFAYNPGIAGSRESALARVAEKKAARNAAKGAVTGTPNLPNATPATSSPDIEWLNAGLEHLPETDRTSIEEASHDANVYGKMQCKTELDRAARLNKELYAMLRTAPDDAIAEKRAEVVDAFNRYARTLAAYSQNCQRCVIAYELRRRGFDVTALPAVMDGIDDVTKNWTELFLDLQVDNVPGDTAHETIANLEATLALYGEGARSIIYIDYLATPNSKAANAHTFIAEVWHGKVLYIDPQSGKEGYTGWQTNFRPATMFFARIDNKQANPAYLHKAVRFKNAPDR